jgi:pimeloyl-ACP methyl ester carboxylesterase
MIRTKFKEGYVSVNGLNMYYETHGTGQPLVLLHDTSSAIGTSFGGILPELAKTRQVIAFELQAHGHTALIIIGDSDLVRPEHAVEMFRLLGGGVFGDAPAGMPNSQLAVLPGTSHITLVSRTELLIPILNSFLDAPMPESQQTGIISE